MISIPSEVDALTRLVGKHFETLRKAPSPMIIGMYRDANPAIAADFADYTDQEVFDATAAVHPGWTDALRWQTPGRGVRTFVRGAAEIGEDAPGALFFAKTLARDDWDEARLKDMRGLKSVVEVHRLREVTSQYGFSRFESAITSDADFEDHQLIVQMAKIADPITWLPAVEQFGEGIFLQFDPKVLAAWKGKASVRARAARLEDGHRQWGEQRFAGRKPPAFQGVAYYLAHSLSHALMSEIAMGVRLSPRARSRSASTTPTHRPRPADLHRCRRRRGDPWRPGRVGAAPGRVHPAGRRPGPALLQRPDLFRPRSSAGRGRSPPTRRRLPRLPADWRSTSCEARNDFLDRALLVEDLRCRGHRVRGSSGQRRWS